MESKKQEPKSKTIPVKEEEIRRKILDLKKSRNATDEQIAKIAQLYGINLERKGEEVEF